MATGTRERVIKNRERSSVSSYRDLLQTPLPRFEYRQTPTWKEGFYPVTVTGCSETGYYKVHYIGWSSRYDELKREDDIVQLPRSDSDTRQSTPADRIIQQLKIQIKENLRGSQHEDSIVTVRIPAEEKDVQQISDIGILYKVYKNRNVYKLNNRQCMDRVLGVGWDYRILNESGDNYHIKTETIRFWCSKRRDLVDYLVFPDHVEEYKLNRGMQFTFTFVRAPGNKKMFSALLNADIL